MELTIEQASQQGAKAYKEGDIQKAEYLFRAILKAQPAHAYANHNLGVIAVSADKIELALPLFKSALEANPKVEQFWLSYIDALIKETQLDTAKQVLAEARKRGLTPEKIDAFEAQVRQSAQSVQPKLPEKNKNLKLKEQPANNSESKQRKKNRKTTSFNADNPPQSHVDSIREHYKSGQYDKAEKLAVLITNQFPSHPFGFNVLGALFEKAGRKSEALIAKQRAVDIVPTDSEAHYNLGNSLKELDRLEEALASFRQSIKLKPDFAEAHNNLAITLQKLGRLEEAELGFRQMIRLESHLAAAHNNLGNILKYQGRKEEAAASYRKSIALKSDNDDARFNLGVQLFDRRLYAMAAEYFNLNGSHKSKIYAIRCSFLQDDQATFFKKFDFLIDQGEINAVIGSLVYCSEIKYGIRKSNPFCNDPLKYVVKTDLSERYDFKNIFVETAKDILIDHSTSHRDQPHLTSGIQTAGNIFAFEKVLKTEIESIIHKEIERYRIQFKNSKEGFIKNWPNSYVIDGWLVCMQSGGRLDSHMHDIGWLTGSIYINVPPKLNPDSGSLVLCKGDNLDALGIEERQKSIIDVVTGSLCLFPASLHHCTVPFEQEENRIVLAFDVKPTQ